MADIATLILRVGDVLGAPNESGTAKIELADDIVDALGRDISLYDRARLLTVLRDLIIWNGTAERHLRALVRYSITADSQNAADECIKTLSVLLSRSDLLGWCLHFIEECIIPTPSGRWIIFYAASGLLRAHRVDLLTSGHIKRLADALQAENPRSESYPKFVRTLRRISDVRPSVADEGEPAMAWLSAVPRLAAQRPRPLIVSSRSHDRHLVGLQITPRKRRWPARQNSPHLVAYQP